MKKISILFLILVLVLSGCQLARTDMETGKDQLVGMLLTREYLDLFDAEAYLQDNLNQLGPGGFLDADTGAYQGKLYAEESIDGVHVQWDFPGVEGIPYFAALVRNEEGESIHTCSDDGLIDGHTHFESTDEGENITLDGTVILSHSGHDITCYFNPVYQTPDGRIYVMSGSGLSTSENNAPGALYSQSASETTTRNSNGKTETYSTTVTISMETAYLPEEYVVIQMSEANTILSRESYLPGALPETLELNPETAYLLLETHNETDDVTRELVDETTESLKTLYCREDGFFGQVYTTLVW